MLEGKVLGPDRLKMSVAVDADLDLDPDPDPDPVEIVKTLQLADRSEPHQMRVVQKMPLPGSGVGDVAASMLQQRVGLSPSCCLHFRRLASQEPGYTLP